MASIDSTVVNVTTVSIGESFGSTTAMLTWIVDAYVLTYASLLLLGGSLATSFGSRRLYMLGMGVFLAASLGCAVAPSPVFLIGARAVQGIGAAMFMPSSLSLLIAQFTEPSRRARMLGLWSAMVATAAAIGPSLGGVLIGSFGWRSIFLINIPVVVVGMALTLRVVPRVSGTRQRVSPVGHLTMLGGVGAAAFLLIQGHSSGFRSPVSVIVAAVVVISGGMLLVQQRRTVNPVVPWDLFRGRVFSTVNAVGFLYSGALYGCLYAMGLFFQNARHVSPMEAGLQLLPMTMCFPLGNILYTRIQHRISNAAIMSVCLSVAGVATLLLIGVDRETPYWLLALVLGIANSGAGLVTASMTAATVAAAGDRHANHAGAILNANRQLGVLVGVAIVGLIVEYNASWDSGLPVVAAVIASAYIAAGFAASTLIRSRESRESSSRKRADLGARHASPGAQKLNVAETHCGAP